MFVCRHISSGIQPMHEHKINTNWIDQLCLQDGAAERASTGPILGLWIFWPWFVPPPIPLSTAYLSPSSSLLPVPPGLFSSRPVVSWPIRMSSMVLLAVRRISFITAHMVLQVALFALQGYFSMLEIATVRYAYFVSPTRSVPSATVLTVVTRA